MKIDYTLNIWSNTFAALGIIIATFVAFWIYRLTKQLSATEKYNHEQKITEKIRDIKIYSQVILADISKYKPYRSDATNKTYYKQAAEIYTIVPEIGVNFILIPSNNTIPCGLVPFDWIKYIRAYDSEDNKTIVVCDFKGVKYFEKFKSPFKEIKTIYQNPNYKNTRPAFEKFTTINPDH